MNSLADPPKPVVSLTPESVVPLDGIRILRERLCQLPALDRFSDEQVEIIYGIAYAMFSQGKLEAAHGLFETLVIYRPTNAKIMLAYGICCKKMLRFDAAIPALMAAFFCDPQDLTAAIHLTECLAVVGRHDECEKVLDPLIIAAQLDGKFESIMRRAKTLRDMLKKQEFLN
jgi:tetratricopeptide (TPR) repeat protein